MFIPCLQGVFVCRCFFRIQRPSRVKKDIVKFASAVLAYCTDPAEFKTVEKYADSIVKKLVDEESEKLLDTKIGAAIEKYDEKIPGWIEKAASLYVSAVESNTERILAGINIEKIVADKISSLEIGELEKLLFGLMRKELNAILVLGALLGFIMGWITPLLGA